MQTKTPTECFYYLISRATLATTSALRKALAEVGIDKVKPAYLGALMALWNEDGLQAAELGRRAGLEPSTTTSLIDRMEKDGLVVRKADPEDRRAQRIHLTDDGRSAQCPILSVVDTTLERVTKGLPSDDLTRTKELLRRVLTNVHKEKEGE